MNQDNKIVLTLTEKNFEDHLKGSLPVLVDFWATWCAPCKAIAPHIEDIAKRYLGKIVVGKLNVDEEPEKASSMGIRALPTLLLFKDGLVVEQIVGAVGKDKIEEAIRSHI